MSAHPTIEERFARCPNRREAAQLYAVLLMQYGDRADWRSINQAVIDRWSEAGLRYVKDQAWKVVRPMTLEADTA